jgi:hypothetical protein
MIEMSAPVRAISKGSVIRPLSNSDIVRPVISPVSIAGPTPSHNAAAVTGSRPNRGNEMSLGRPGPVILVINIRASSTLATLSPARSAHCVGLSAENERRLRTAMKRQSAR